ncbi:hypothetical protein KSS14E_0930 [Escherichia coli phage KS_S14]|nr:hypothetical protein KSS14E_0930 [Escherichia coli phage KS_S14]
MVTKTVIPTDITKLKNESLNKNNNLSDLADRAAAWLNVRPIGSTPLAGDPVSDYDAATKRWVENKLNTGTVGPTMNGVMNYGVGDFHLRDSRAYIQPYEVVSDGQLLNRADWPELWAYAQMVGAIDDSVWLADVGQRGKYSTGDGTTTFRVPDRNGVQLNSIKGLFARGDGGGMLVKLVQYQKLQHPILLVVFLALLLVHMKKRLIDIHLDLVLLGRLVVKTA